MNVTIQKAAKHSNSDHLVLVCTEKSKLNGYGLSKQEISYLKEQLKSKKRLCEVNQYNRRIYAYCIEENNKSYQTIEKCRKAGNTLLTSINNAKIEKVTIIDDSGNQESAFAVAEGMALGNYQFLKYFKDAKKKANSLKIIGIYSKNTSSQEIEELNNLVSSVYLSRDLINEPVIYLTAVQLSKEIQKAGKSAGFKVDVFNKAKIQALKMGGLLAVNKGSIDPPTFNILEWKPKNSKNKKPFVLVGKGVVYDTGGLSLKPTANSMDSMKSDMSGSAAVVGALHAIAKNKLPIHVVGLIPATDNRPGGNAYTPGDVITMHNGLTVEVLNTDAEGRLILADALSYARKYKPELVIDLATLTGSAQRTVGQHATVVMGTADSSEVDKLEESGFSVYERLAELPFWDEYNDMIRSDMADIKNIGGASAGAITAGKFLEYFTKDKKNENGYPWLHLDIAGTAFLDSPDGYRPKGGTGVGVRLLYDFLKEKAK
ncbi:MAG: peptidase M17 [Flavobacteriales bacterium]|nr:MAG: peptidase M17 [Flavobacteriales bacterium]